MKVWILLCLLLQDTSHAQTPSVDSSGDDIRIIRTDLDLVVAGRVEVYVEGEWRAVCHSNWGENDAHVACRQLGFSDGGARNCRESCFGKSTLSAGLSNFMCNGNESRLTDCQSDLNNGCGEDAGVICRNVITTTSSPLSPLTPQQGQFTPVVTTITQKIISTVTQQVTSTVTPQVTTTQQAQEACKEETTSYTAIGGGLGGLTALMTLLLVLVVLGWVHSCYRRKKYSVKESYSIVSKPHPFDNDTPTQMATNPSYSVVSHSKSHPSVQDTPTPMATNPSYSVVSNSRSHPSVQDTPTSQQTSPTYDYALI